MSVGVRQVTIYPSCAIPLEALCNLVSPEARASGGHGVAKWAHGAKFAEIIVTVDELQAYVTAAVLHLSDFFQRGA